MRVWPLRRAKLETSGFAEPAQRLGIGNGPKPRRKLSSMIGCEPAISTLGTRTDSGGTWAAVTTVSSQRANGSRQLKSRMFCCDMKRCAPQRWSKALIMTDCHVCAPLLLIEHRAARTHSLRMICAPIAKVPCRVSSSRVVISSFRICLTLRQERCNDLSCESSCEGLREDLWSYCLRENAS